MESSDLRAAIDKAEKQHAELQKQINDQKRLIKRRIKDEEVALGNIEILEGVLEQEKSRDIVDLEEVRQVLGAIADNKTLLEGVREAIFTAKVTVTRGQDALKIAEEWIKIHEAKLGKVVHFDRQRSAAQG